VRRGITYPSRRSPNLISRSSSWRHCFGGWIGHLLSTQGRVLLIDLCLERPEVAALLDLEEAPNIYHLAHASQLSTLTGADLEAHIQWRDGLAVLPGIVQPSEREHLTDQFIEQVISQARSRYDYVVLDLGRPRAQLPRSITEGWLMWVISASPLGLAALDRAVGQLEAAECRWLKASCAVLNMTSAKSFRSVDRFLGSQYGIRVVGEQNSPRSPEAPIR
jgi:Mrp family chromosome partitioning ATPase